MVGKELEEKVEAEAEAVEILLNFGPRVHLLCLVHHVRACHVCHVYHVYLFCDVHHARHAFLVYQSCHVFPVCLL